MIAFLCGPCYTVLEIYGERNVVAVEYSSKLDLLREMARACEGEASKAYLVGLLAERAEEEECTAEVLAWVGEALAGR
jgi:hypothetical protein